LTPSSESTPQPGVKSEPRHYAYIDALRGLAFLCVMATHCTLPVGPFGARPYFVEGSYGVELFFLVSALTLSSSMEARRKTERFPLASFYLRRLFRIAPLFWLAIWFYWQFPNIMPAFWQEYWAPGGVQGFYYPLTALFLHGWHPLTFNSIVPGGWSIAVEMTFYAIFPFLFRRLNSLRKSVLAVLASLPITYLLFNFAYSPLRYRVFPEIPQELWNGFINLFFPSQLPVFLIGMAIYRFLQKTSVREILAERFWARSLACFSIMLCAGFLVHGVSAFVTSYLLIVMCIAVFVVSVSSNAQKWLVNRPMQYLGKISFSCYLTHFVALGLALRILGIHLDAVNRTLDLGDSTANFVLYAKLLAITLALTTVFATLTYHTIELGGIALGKRVVTRLNRAS
jgi:peptidoglycan/LPS O-acetylase OafA/YrhL